VGSTEAYLARAMAEFDQGIRRYPRSAGLLYWNALLAEKGHDAGDTARKFEMARLLAETLIVENRNPGEVADGRNVMRMLELNQRPAWPRQARQALAAGQCEQALQLLGDVAEADRNPQWYVVFADAGGTCSEKGDLDAGERALVVLAEGERRYPRDADIRYSHWSLLITMTRYAEAERELRETMALAEELIRSGEDAATVSQARRVLAVMRDTEAATNRRP
jgi:tetratricopeptide (TPR) repeat protein